MKICKKWVRIELKKKNARYMTHLQGMKTAYPRIKVSGDLTHLLFNNIAKIIITSWQNEVILFPHHLNSIML